MIDWNTCPAAGIAGQARKLAIATLMTNSWPRIERHAPHVIAQINGLQVGCYAQIVIP